MLKRELKNYLKSQKTVKPVAQNWYTRNNCYLHFVRESGTRPYFPLFFLLSLFLNISGNQLDVPNSSWRVAYNSTESTNGKQNNNM